MKKRHWIIPALFSSAAFAVACGDASHEAIAEESATVDAGGPSSQCQDAGPMAPGALDMASPEPTLEQYARLRTASSCTVQLTRRGVPLTIEYAIK